MKGHPMPIAEALRDTTLRGDLALTDVLLEARYAQQFNDWLPSWWAWYEQWGTSFFAPTGSAETNPPTVVERKHSREKVGQV